MATYYNRVFTLLIDGVLHMTGVVVRWSHYVTLQEEMSHALATMRFKDEPATIKPMGESKNSLLSRRKNKKRH